MWTKDAQLALALAAIFLFSAGYSGTFYWKEDEVSFTDILSESDTELYWNMTANRYVLPADDGNYRLHLKYGSRNYSTDCLKIGVLAEVMQDHLNKIVPVKRNGGIEVQRRGDGSSDYHYGYQYTFTFNSSSQASQFDLSVRYGERWGCEDVTTYGLWNDSSNWVGGTAPDADATTNNIYIYEDSGQIVLTEDVKVRNLYLQGGTLVLHATECPEGYLPAERGGGTKCFAVPAGRKDWLGAQDACDNRRPQGTGHLARVSTGAENEMARLLCQGTRAKGGCWLGLRREGAQDEWGWAGPAREEMAETYRAWGPGEPSNATYRRAREGERCARMAQSRWSFRGQQGGAWEDDYCGRERRYICELYGTTTGYTMTISTRMEWSGGALYGAGQVTVNNVLKIDAGASVLLDGQAVLLNSKTGTIGTGATVDGRGGAVLANEGTLEVAGAWFTHYGSYNSSVYPAEDADEDNEETRAPATLWNRNGGALELRSTTLGWALRNTGTSHISVPAGSALGLGGGGLLRGGTLDLGAGAVLNVTGGALALQARGYHVLELAADRPVAAAQDTGANGEDEGVYRLAVAGEASGCVPYHATAEELQDILEEMSSVSAVGGVHIRRWGNGKESWDYGYRYSIYFDEVTSRNSSATGTSTDISLSCVGSQGCGCADPLGPVVQSGSIALGCVHPNGSEVIGQSSSDDPVLCLLDPTISIGTGRLPGECPITGSGRVEVRGGSTHVLLSPAVAPDLLLADGGEATVMSGAFSGGAVTLEGGVLWVADSNAEAEAALRLLYANDSAQGRDDDYLLSPGVFSSSLDSLTVSGGELRLVSTHKAFLNTTNFYWTGGNISGLPALNALSTMSIEGEENEVLYMLNGVQLINAGAGAWSSGSIMASEGARLMNSGYFEISAVGSSLSYDDSYSQWSGQYDWKEKWYWNPVCNARCAKAPEVINQGTGEFVSTSGSNATIHATFYNYGQVTSESGAFLALAGGGTTTGAVEIQGHVEISGGEVYFSPDTQVTGSGVLEFSGGRHQPPDVVEPTILLTGAELTYSAVSISMVDGITIEDGVLNILATSTVLNVTSNMTISGGRVAFPGALGLAAVDPAIHPHAGLGAVADRSRLNVGALMVWEGGEVAGNADVVAWGRLRIRGAGGKRVSGLARVLNRGEAIWTEGDIVRSAQASFENEGTLELEDPSTFEGRVILIGEEEVCCPKGKKVVYGWESS